MDNQTRPRLVLTWISMALALAVTVAMLDWTNSGTARPLWVLLGPAVLGVVGAAFAVRSRSLGWAVLSVVWGIALVPVTFVAVTLVSGP